MLEKAKPRGQSMDDSGPVGSWRGQVTTCTGQVGGDTTTLYSTRGMDKHAFVKPKELHATKNEL